MSNVAVHKSRQKSRSVLISGASIAGPALAYWLDRYGFEVTVVERAPSIRVGGYPIDIRGTAMGVIDRMGLRPQIEAAHIASRALTFVDTEGKTIGAIPVYDLTGNEAGQDVELPRGTLTTLLYGLTRNSNVRYRFDDSIEAIADEGAGVDVRFKSGERQRYDVVIGADGLHSHTRRLAFGPEEPFNHYLGYTFNLFSMPNDRGLSHGAIVYAEAGRAAVVFAVRDNPELFVGLIFATETPPFGARLDKAEQIQRTEAAFADGGWEVPRLLDAMRQADDLFFDTVSQIRMPCWSKGRLAVTGDAAYAPSFRSGQGTSIALVGAYVLAGELAAHDDPADAFAAYERIVRPFVEANQALAIREAGSLLLPRTQEQLETRNRMLAALQDGHAAKALSGHAREVHSSLRLPDY
ncbi:FAD-dependent monooxygenase [Bradyrhizobium sp. dw_411]|uniref:FAD-dependent monooxygenase n=1 Tax=Bradyrhizobium sp. dw_411 TaxID=2720082 RepID=UPI001BCDD682|nr:FAD-dependent monooxygenase [Bradyrhizobium sp. dw_411]